VDRVLHRVISQWSRPPLDPRTHERPASRRPTNPEEYPPRKIPTNVPMPPSSHPLPRSFLHRRSVLAITRRFRGFNVIPPRVICAKKARCLQRGLFATKMFRLRRSLPIALTNMTPNILAK
jgi:hypothetical protein